MTPELRRSVASRARVVQQRVNRDGIDLADIDPIAVATDARRLFEEAADETRVRWLTLELCGYADPIDARPLHDVLRVAAGHRLATHVSAYRTQRGVDQVTLAEFRHFFVESLDGIATVRAKVAASSGPPTLVLDFGPQPGAAGYPRSGEFSRDVFDRIVLGFFAALHLQLADLVRWG